MWNVECGMWNVEWVLDSSDEKYWYYEYCTCSVKVLLVIVFI